MAPAFHTIQTAYAGVAGMQDSPSPLRLMATAVLFLETCKVLRLDPSEMIDKAHRLTRHAEDHASIELAALRTYLKQEN